MKLLRLVLATLALISVSYAQSNVAGDRFFHGVLDGTGATSTRPFRTGTVLPGSCAGDEWFVLKSGNSKTIYYCSGTVFAQYSVSTGGLSAPASNGLMSYAGSNATAHASLSDVTALTGTGTTAASNFGLATVAGSNSYTDLLNKPTIPATLTPGTGITNLSNTWSVAYGTTAGTAVQGNDARFNGILYNPANAAGCLNNNGTGTISWITCSSGSGLASSGTNTIPFNTSGTATRAATSADFVALFGSGSCNGYLKNDGTCSTPSGTVPATTSLGQSFQNNGTSLVLTAPVLESDAAGIACDNNTDNTTAMNSGSLANHMIHLKDGGTCLTKQWTPASNTSWVCNACTVGHITSDTGNPLLYMGFKTNIEMDGIALDDRATNHQSFVGGANAQTTIVTVSGGSGWQPNYKVPWTATGGGCTSPARGYFTTDASGVPNANFTYITGYGCTSTPTTFTSSTYCGDGYSGCVAPTFTWAAGLTPQAATTTSAIAYLDHDDGVILRDVTVRSTGATAGNLAGAENGINTFHTGAIMPNLRVENTVQGTHLYDDSDGFVSRRVYVSNIFSDGSQFDGVQFKGHPNYGELDGGLIENVGDALIGSGQQGNGISLFDTDHAYVHRVKVLNPNFSGVRVTGDSNINSTKPTTQNRIEDLVIEGNQEMGVWAELGAEGNYFRNITVRPSSTQSSGGCFEDTNSNQKPHYAYNFFDEMHCIGQQQFGAAVEHASVRNSTFTDIAVPIRVGFGGTGEGNFLSGNTCESTGTGYSTSMFCFFLDRFKGTTGKYVGVSTLSQNQPVEYPFAGPTMTPIIYADFSNFPIVSGIDTTSPAVIHYYASTAVQWPFTVGNTYMIEGVYGFTNAAGQSINGKLCGVTAVTTTTITCGGQTGVPVLDATGYTATPFSLAPPGRGNGMMIWVYQSSGTTPAWSANTNFHVTNAFAQ